jgi:quinone-modifying oxidoreductase subunit QmoB
MSEMKTAAYVCSGCGIGERIDTAQLAKIAQREGKMALVREHAFLCSGEGVQAIRDDVEKEAVTHVMIAACSRRAKTEAFHFPTVALARANLREGVLWAVTEGADHDEVRQEMAADYVRMGCAELKKMKFRPATPTPGRTGILVVGGGCRDDRGARGGADGIRRDHRREGIPPRRLGRQARQAGAVEGSPRRAAGHRCRGPRGGGQRTSAHYGAP